MTNPFQNSRGGICLLRLSAIGDVAHAAAVVRALQDARPERPIVWLVGRVEAPLARLVSGVEVVPVDKARPLAEMVRVRRLLAGRTFEALLHAQVAFRASVLSLAVRAPVRVGFDRARGKELQGWFVNRRVDAAPAPGEHVLDGLMRFAAAVGARPARPRWDLAIPAEVRAWAEAQLPAGSPVLAINGCASRAVRDWPAERVGAVAAHAVRRLGWRVVLCGGPAARERVMADAITAQAGVPLIDLVGRTTLPQLAAVLARARGLLSPDSGPVHVATAVGTPTIGLYAVSNVRRTGPYGHEHWCVDRREEAAQRFRGRPAAALRWNEAIDHPDAMGLIPVDAVIERLDALAAAGAVVEG